MNPSSQPIAACPEHLQLVALAEGTLADNEVSVLTNHVSQCRTCDAKLGAIEEQSDDLVRALAMLPAQDDDEQTFRELQEKLLANPETFADGEELTTEHLREMPAELILPMQLGNYELLEKIGAGANGAVFRARHRRLDKIVAIKLLLHAERAAIEEFLNEMRVIGKLSHPNMIQATDAGEYDGIYFLVMEYVPGMDVSSLLRRVGPLPISEACEIARQTALGLCVAHDSDLVHRDVKTSNLLFTSSGQIKLLDLGLAMLSSQKSVSTNDISGPRGTADYMAPEQWRDAGTVSPQADIYSLGCTLYKLLTGAPPFRPLPESIANLQEAHLHAPVPKLQVKQATLPSGLENLILEMLSKSPSDRPISAKVVADRLRRFSAGARLDRIVEKVLPDAPREPVAISAPSLPLLTRRSAVGIGVLGILSAIAWKLNQPVHRPAIRLLQWRSVDLVFPNMILADGEGLSDAIEDAKLEEIPHGWIATSDNALLLHMGSPLSRPFRFRATLTREEWQVPGGLVFRLRQQESRFQFHTLEVIEVGGERWLRWNRYEDGLMGMPETLAESSVGPASGKAVELDITVGETGFPTVVLDGTAVAQAAWSISGDARTLITTHPRQLVTTYAGRIGILHRSGTTTVQKTQLMYVK